MRAQTERAIAVADVVLFLIDARTGITPDDAAFARHLRKSNRPVILLANKCEGKAAEAGVLEAYRLGLGDPVPVSAAHGEGLDGLYEALLPYAEKAGAFAEDDVDADATTSESADAETDDEAAEKPNSRRHCRAAQCGQVDSGQPPARRGADADWARSRHHPRRDRHRLAASRPAHGAGRHRRAAPPRQVSDAVEKLATSNTIDAIRMAHVVILVVEADAILDKQDLTVASLVIEEGRALVIAVNKWDAVTDRRAALQRLSDRLEAALPQAKGLPTVTLSALEGTGTEKLMKAVRDVYAAWNRRIPTAALNRWLEEATTRNPPPMARGGSRIRLRYGTQVKARPPTFAFFTQRADDLPESYSRYLVNSLRETFDLAGVPIRLGLRKRANPYADKADD